MIKESEDVDALFLVLLLVQLIQDPAGSSATLPPPNTGSPPSTTDQPSSTSYPKDHHHQPLTKHLLKATRRSVPSTTDQPSSKDYPKDHHHQPLTNHLLQATLRITTINH
ncbi:hypothetical protein RRG08_036155 [Elysia crispata]|uniref:Uncharacterized protein n=1 Tax=Elysia crispata TaxID=231223 RepID=A0AAE1CES7_9GAST|nr:hypothetical protein RRG08_036155 [Elysia crispata]